jgi:hypothetical protein
VDVNDMQHLLSAWGTDGADANGDGNTDDNVRLVLISLWGQY